MTDVIESHELTYPGRVDPRPGTFMGPGIDGRAWQVVGAVYAETTDQTKVSVEVAS